MFFIPRNSKFYTLITHTRPAYRYFLTIFIASMLIIIWLYGVYARLEASINQGAKQIDQLYKQSKQLKQAECSCAKITESINALKLDLRSYIPQQNTQNYLQSRLVYVLETAKKVGLSLGTYTADKIINKEWCCKNKTHFDFNGSIQQVGNFFYALQASGKMITCDNISLSRQENNLFLVSCDLNFIAVS